MKEILLILLLCPLVWAEPFEDNNNASKYLMSFHDANKTGTDVNAAYLATSNDGISWTALNGGNPVFYAPQYQLRDPSIMYSNSAGYYYICYTNNDLYDGNSSTIYKGSRIGIAKSSNSDPNSSWTHLAWIYIGDPNIKSSTTWAPEWFVDIDGSIHIFVAYGYHIKEIHCLDSAIDSNWSSPKDINTASTTAIDPFVVNRNGIYYMFFKKYDNPFVRSIACADSVSLAGPYNLVYDGNWTGFDYPREGVCVISLGSNSWIMYSEVENGKVQYSESNDNWATWSPLNYITIDDPAIKIGHGTIIKYTRILPSDLNKDYYVNYKDLKIMADYWLSTDCTEPNNCGGADFEPADGAVNFRDFSNFAKDW